MVAERDNSFAGLPGPGEMLADRYRIERVIGVGGMGVVMEATHLRLGERFAIKFLNGECSEDPESVARFVREAWAAAKIRSDHAARVSDVATLSSGRPYLVMEFLVGNDLNRELQAGPLPSHLAVDFVLQASEALAEGHKLGIIHRDLKPENLFLTRRADGSPWIKVLDFGISKVAAVGSLTATDSLMGTPLYMAPEQLVSAKHVDARADIWALGVILYELLSGQLPFSGAALPQICASVMNSEPRRLVELAPEVPRGLEAAVSRCLEKDPSDRFGSLGELASAIAPFGGDGASSSAAYIKRVNLAPSPAEPAPQTAVGQADGHADAALTSAEHAPAQVEDTEANIATLPMEDGGVREAPLRLGSVTAEPVSRHAAQPGGQRRVRRAAIVCVLGVGVLIGAFLATVSGGDEADPETGVGATGAIGAPATQPPAAAEDAAPSVSAVATPTVVLPASSTATTAGVATSASSAAPVAKPKARPQPGDRDPWQGR